MTATAGFDVVVEYSKPLLKQIIQAAFLGGASGGGSDGQLSVSAPGLGAGGDGTLILIASFDDLTLNLLPGALVLQAVNNGELVLQFTNSGDAQYLTAAGPIRNVAVEWSVTLNLTPEPDGLYWVLPPASSNPVTVDLAPPAADNNNAQVLTAAGQIIADFNAGATASTTSAIENLFSATIGTRGTLLPAPTPAPAGSSGSIGGTTEVTAVPPPGSDSTAQWSIVGEPPSSIVEFFYEFTDTAGADAGNPSAYTTSLIAQDGTSDMCIVLSERTFDMFFVCAPPNPSSSSQSLNLSIVAGTCGGNQAPAIPGAGVSLTKFQLNLHPPTQFDLTIQVFAKADCVSAWATYSGTVTPTIKNTPSGPTVTLSPPLTLQSTTASLGFWCQLAAFIIGFLSGGQAGLLTGVAATVLADALIGPLAQTQTPGTLPQSLAFQLPPGLLSALSPVTIGTTADSVIISGIGSGIPDPPPVLGTVFGQFFLIALQPIGTVVSTTNHGPSVTDTSSLVNPEANPLASPSTEVMTDWLYQFSVSVTGAPLSANATVQFVAVSDNTATTLQTGIIKIPVNTSFVSPSAPPSVLISATLDVVVSVGPNGTPELQIKTQASDGNYSFQLIAREEIGGVLIAEAMTTVTVTGQYIRYESNSLIAAAATSAMLARLSQVHMSAPNLGGPGAPSGRGHSLRVHRIRHSCVPVSRP
jgi:hypothetical protein